VGPEVLRIAEVDEAEIKKISTVVVTFDVVGERLIEPLKLARHSDESF
jgi:hypothetical protein